MANEMVISQIKQRLELLWQAVEKLEVTPSPGPGGTTDYDDLTNKPKINNVTLSGNKTGSDLGFVDIGALDDYLTIAAAALAYQPIGNYATESDLSSYLTSSDAASTYQTQAGMSSYLTSSDAASTYQTQSGMSSYLTSSDASSTYQT